eukprot:1159110-Pelagomonas_calceolata.AAC.4
MCSWQTGVAQHRLRYSNQSSGLKGSLLVEGKVQRPGNIDAPCMNSSSALGASPRKQHVQHHLRIASTESITMQSNMSNSASACIAFL